MPDCVWVTGGAGFVGSSLAIAIRRKFPRAAVLALDNLRRRGSEINLPRLRAAGVVFVHADVRSLGDLTAIETAPDLIVECSAEPSVLAGYGGSPAYLVETNLTGCFHCLEIARRTKADFLFVSTSRVYPMALVNRLAYTETPTRYALAPEQAQAIRGASEHGISEEFPLDGARSLYGMTKLAAELMTEEYADAYGLRFVIDRCGLLTGPWQMARSDQGVMALWMAAHVLDRPLRYIGFGGSGKQVRDFLHIEDFCELVLDQIVNLPLYAGWRWNVGGGAANSLSLVELTELCRQISGHTVPVTPAAENRPADVRIYIMDHRLVSAVNGWTPRRDAAKTLTDIFDWIRRESEVLDGIL